MTGTLRKAWAEMVRPLLRRPPELQVAALCCRQGDGGTEVLLITSRDTGRWVLPKGWPMAKRSTAESAAQEAWEEAGVRTARLWPEPVGVYHYDKRLDGGVSIPVEVLVFRMDVEELSDSYPEVDSRTRCWLSPRAAAGRVDEPELQALLRRV